MHRGRFNVNMILRITKVISYREDMISIRCNGIDIKHLLFLKSSHLEVLFCIQEGWLTLKKWGDERNRCVQSGRFMSMILRVNKVTQKTIKY